MTALRTPSQRKQETQPSINHPTCMYQRVGVYCRLVNTICRGDSLLHGVPYSKIWDLKQSRMLSRGSSSGTTMEVDIISHGCWGSKPTSMAIQLDPLASGLPSLFSLSGGCCRHVRGCQNYGPLLDPLNTTCRIILGTPTYYVPYCTRDPLNKYNFDNPPCTKWASPGGSGLQPRPTFQLQSRATTPRGSI